MKTKVLTSCYSHSKYEKANQIILNDVLRSVFEKFWNREFYFSIKDDVTNTVNTLLLSYRYNPNKYEVGIISADSKLPSSPERGQIQYYENVIEEGTLFVNKHLLEYSVLVFGGGGKFIDKKATTAMLHAVHSGITTALILDIDNYFVI